MERTFLMIKPDAVRRGLIGQIIARFEAKGFKMVAGKLMNISDELVRKHYKEHEGRPFYQDLITFMTSGPVFAMVWEGDNIIKLSRLMMGTTDPEEATPGSIRGDFATKVNRNVIHGSDSSESASREIHLFFSEKELVTY
ncbi:nucleoside-diphosphate kinase [Sporolactobacillus sp. Y61]|jgi:nucleoside-diphosphate kinase|uniref:Nucleoside diphosphate kinase n=1 Tax=Sporolactobacillus sp. Y61 TaxID=3160863 RepID=A0AAU8ID40_9BACL|nr:nucleoside-diphosphate kinase [Sporolactobacillus sp. THM19-2]RYL93227.1 nucleoside-diphosphate kinase [Sporolactobacillus sp. THM19-2]